MSSVERKLEELRLAREKREAEEAAANGQPGSTEEPAVTPVVKEPAVVTEGEHVEETEEDPLEVLKAEAAKWKEKAQKRDADTSMAFQDRAEFKRELEAKNKMIEEMQRKFEALETKLNERSRNVSLDDFALDAEFEEEYPEIAKNAKKAAAFATAKALERVQSVEDQFKAILEARKVDESMTALQKHKMEVTKSHPDIDEFVEGQYAEAFTFWANKPDKPAYFAQVVSNPLAFAPSDVSYVISQFKQEARIGAQKAATAKKPAPGDVAIGTKSKAKVEVQKEDNTIATMSHAEYLQLLTQNKKNPARMQEIINARKSNGGN